MRLIVANGKIIGGGTHEATIGMEVREHDRLNRPDLSKLIVLSGNFYASDISDWDIIMGYGFMVSNAVGAPPHHATLVREDKERLTWRSADHAPGLSEWTGDDEERIVRAVKTASTKFHGDRGGHLMEYGMGPQLYNRMAQHLRGEKPETDVFALRDAPQLRKCTRHWHKGDSAWSKHWRLMEWGPMYWHGAQEDTRRTVNKMIADRAMAVLVVTGRGSSPCPLEDLIPTLNSITLNYMQFEPQEQLFIDAKGIPMPAAEQAWSTKAFLVDGSQCQPTGDEAFITRVEAVPMRVMFEEKSDPTVSVEVLSHPEIDRVVAYMRIGMHDRVAARRGRAQAKSPNWWDHLELVTGKFDKDEFVARVMVHSADQYDGLIGSDRPAWGFPRVADKFDEFQPVVRNFQRLSVGTAAHVDEQGISDEEITDVDPQEAYTAVKSVIPIPRQVAEEAKQDRKVAELRDRLIEAYSRLYSGVANRNPPDRGKYGTAKIKLKPNPKIYRHREYQLQEEQAEAMKKLLKEFIERGWIEPSDSKWASPAFIVPKKEKG